MKLVTLKKEYEFTKVFKKGKKYNGETFCLFVIKNNKQINRIGVVATKKYGNSVKRSLYTRYIKENYRLLDKDLYKGYDFIFLARDCENLNYKKVNNDFYKLFVKANLFATKINKSQ